MNRIADRYSPEPNTGCWLWTGCLTSGYGQLRVDGKKTGAHVYAYEHYIGPVPVGQYVWHRCHVSWCVNPDHLALGSSVESREFHGTAPCGDVAARKGEANGRAKLTDEDIYAIRDSSDSTVATGKLFGVHHTHVGAIRRYLRWKHI